MASTLERKRVIVSAMRLASEAEGSLSDAQVRGASEMLGCTPRHVRRLVRSGIHDPVISAKPTSEHIDILFSTHGNCAKAAKKIAHLNLLPVSMKTKRPVSERTMRRALEEGVDPAYLAAARNGWAGFRTATCYGSKYAPHKGHTYATDSTPFDVLVRDDNNGEVIDLWGTPVIDEATRFVISESVTDGSPDTQTSVAALAAAVQGYEAENGVWVGGLPDRVLSDNGSEYKTSAVAAGLVRLGFTLLVSDEGSKDGGEEAEEVLGSVRAQFSPAGEPWVNGIVERFHRTTHRDLCSELPGYVPPDWDTFERLERRAYWQTHPSLLLTRSQFQALLHDWIMEYNYRRKHSSLNGLTPFEAWCTDRHVLQKPDPEAVRLAMLSDGTRVVDRGKIQAFTTLYYSSDLAAHHGRTVEIRYLPGGQPNSVEIFHNGAHVATAVRKDLLNQNDLGQIVHARRKQTETVLAHMAGGEKFKTTSVNKRLVELGFKADDLPEIPDAPIPSERPRTRHRKPRDRDAPATSTHASASDRDAARALVANYAPDAYEDIF